MSRADGVWPAGFAATSAECVITGASDIIARATTQYHRAFMFDSNECDCTGIPADIA